MRCRHGCSRCLGDGAVPAAIGWSETPRGNEHEVAPASVAGALNGTDLLLYAQKIVRMERPVAACGYQILSWVRAKNGAILTLAEFASAEGHPKRLPGLDRQVVHCA